MQLGVLASERWLSDIVFGVVQYPINEYFRVKTGAVPSVNPSEITSDLHCPNENIPWQNPTWTQEQKNKINKFFQVVFREIHLI